MSDTTRDQAIAQCQAIAQMVAAYGVDYDRLEELRDLQSGNMLEPDDAEELADLEEAAGNCESQDDALEQIQEYPLSVEYRSGWVNPGGDMTPEEFRIVLQTGGPHVEIVGDCDLSQVRVIYLDWGGSGELFDFDREVVVTYCSLVGIGE